MLGANQCATQVASLIARTSDSPKWRKEASLALNGNAWKIIRETTPRQELRQRGIFFTSHDMANYAASKFLVPFSKDSQIIDPSVGGGDLLLAVLEKWHKEYPQKTSSLWSERLHGIEIRPTLARLSRLRLSLKSLVLTNTPADASKSSATLFSNVNKGSVFNKEDCLSNMTHVIMNPPFHPRVAPPTIDWATGKINSAAYHLDFILNNIADGTAVVAILPEVLRCGTRYERWRNSIENRAYEMSINSIGKFDKWTDVDVFVLSLVRGSGTKGDWNTLSTNNILGDIAEIRVGPVVDYRDEHLGPWFPYLPSPYLERPVTRGKNLPKRRFQGRSIPPPFIAVYRTSSPGEWPRIRAAVVKGNKPIVVENHLMTIKLHSTSSYSLDDIRAYLESNGVTEWLDSYIRCRHLTVQSLKEIPLRKIKCHQA